MRAFKCDRCGDLYEDYENRLKDGIYSITKNPNRACCCLDLCEACNDELQTWVGMGNTTRTMDKIRPY